MRHRTDSLLRSLSVVLADESRPLADRVALARAQVTLIVARRRAARTERAMAWTVRNWADALPCDDDEADATA